MNIIDLQERLKDMPEQALMREMQMPTGTAPQFLVLGELKRRKRMRDDYQRMQASDMKTVAEEAVTAAGVPQAGIMGVSQSMAPRSAIAQNTGVNDMMEREATRAPQPEQPMMMADGGYVQRMRQGGFGDNVEYDYQAFLEEMGLRDTPDARDTFRRYQERMNARYALEGPNTDPTLFMRGLDRAPEQPSIADVSTDINTFMPGAETAPPMMAAPTLGPAPTAGTIDFDASIAETPAAPPPLPDTLAGDELIRAAAEFSGPSEQSRAALSRVPEDVLGPFGGAGEEIAPSVGDFEYGGLTDPQQVTQGERPEFVGDVIDYLRGLGADAPSQIGGYEFSPEELEATSSVPVETQDTMDDLARESAEEAARLREERGITDARESIGAGIVEGDQERIDRVLEAARDALPVGMDTGTPLQIPEEGIGALLPPRQAPEVSSAGSTSGTGGGTGGAGGYGAIESRIARMLEEREKSAQADKWLALAQTGLALMASDQPTIGGAIGEAGLAGIGAMQKARSQYDKDIMELLNMQAGVQRARAAGARASSTTAGLSGMIDDARQELTALNAEARSYRDISTDPITGEPRLVDMTPPGLRARIVAVEDRLAQLNALRSGSASTAQFDATAQ